MIRDTVRRRLAAHIALRLIVATVLLGLAVIVQLRAPDALPVNSFFVVIGFAYVASLGFIASLRFVDRFPWLADVHFAIDALLVSAVVFLTGGVSSLSTTLYVLPIVAASTLRSGRSGLQVAALNSVLFVVIVLAQYLHAAGLFDLPMAGDVTGELPPATVAQYTVGLNVFGFFAVALLSGSLAERARRADDKLEQATVEIADLQAFNQYVIDNLVSGLATADGSNRLLTFNRSAMLITGYRGALPIGRPAGEVLQLPAAFLAGIDEALGRTRIKRTDFEFKRDDGTTFELGLSVAALPLPDGSRGFIYSFQDVTDVKRLERHAAMQQRLAAVGEMAAGIAHEIRNPLASISGSMQLLRQELPLSLDQAQLMDIVLRESERLNQTIKSFLAYARPQRSPVQPVDLRTVVQETATLLRNSVELSDKHQIDVSIPPDPVMLEADEGQVRQIVWNLATNGLRAMPSGGRLQLSARTDPGPGGIPMAALEVRDQGVGIPAEEIDHIFQPFRGSFGKGTGLGLAIVHRITTDYGGRIDVRSQRGQGTTFTVALPATRDRATVRQAS
jgi:two-component system sensor histidine kinase PilS (NtrC family)